jgi:hypothetical protein
MTTLYVVTHQVGGFAREDASVVCVAGIYSDPAVAETVRKAVGYGATVTSLELDHIPAGHLQTIKALGLKLPTA